MTLFPSARLRRFSAALALLLMACVTGIAACSSTDNAQPVAIKQPLPAPESLNYTLLDVQNAKIGTAQVSIQNQATTLLLSQVYTDLAGHIDSGTVTVDAATLHPISAHRELKTASIDSTLDVTYSDSKVATTVVTGGRTTKHEETITPNSTYDDQEAFFLLRTLDFTPGNTVHFAIVVSDASKGTISRALATARVVGKSQIKVGGKPFDAWQVQLTGAGATNTAWFDSAPSRRLLRYFNSRETSLELANP
jgi:hypothetical protein